MNEHLCHQCSEEIPKEKWGNEWIILHRQSQTIYVFCSLRCLADHGKAMVDRRKGIFK